MLLTTVNLIIIAKFQYKYQQLVSLPDEYIDPTVVNDESVLERNSQALSSCSLNYLNDER